MKYLLSLLTIVCCSLSIQAQEDDFVTFMVPDNVFEYLDVSATQLNEDLSEVQVAFANADDYAIGKKKSDLVKIVHSAPARVANLSSLATGVQENPDFQGLKYGLVYAQFKEEANKQGNMIEVSLRNDEVEALENIAFKVKVMKTKLKNSNYAIHASQRSEGSFDNIQMMVDFTNQLKEIFTILTIGSKR